MYKFHRTVILTLAALMGCEGSSRSYAATSTEATTLIYDLFFRYRVPDSGTNSISADLEGADELIISENQQLFVSIPGKNQVLIFNASDWSAEPKKLHDLPGASGMTLLANQTQLAVACKNNDSIQIVNCVNQTDDSCSDWQSAQSLSQLRDESRDKLSMRAPHRVATDAKGDVLFSVSATKHDLYIFRPTQDSPPKWLPAEILLNYDSAFPDTEQEGIGSKGQITAAHRLPVFFISDNQNNRVYRVHTGSGNQGLTLSLIHSDKHGSIKFDGPAGMTITPDDNYLVVTAECGDALFFFRIGMNEIDPEQEFKLEVLDGVYSVAASNQQTDGSLYVYAATKSFQEKHISVFYWSGQSGDTWQFHQSLSKGDFGSIVDLNTLAINRETAELIAIGNHNATDGNLILLAPSARPLFEANLFSFDYEAEHYLEGDYKVGRVVVYNPNSGNQSSLFVELTGKDTANPPFSWCNDTIFAEPDALNISNQTQQWSFYLNATNTDNPYNQYNQVLVNVSLLPLEMTPSPVTTPVPEPEFPIVEAVAGTVAGVVVIAGLSVLTIPFLIKAYCHKMKGASHHSDSPSGDFPHSPSLPPSDPGPKSADELELGTYVSVSNLKVASQSKSVVIAIDDESSLTTCQQQATTCEVREAKEEEEQQVSDMDTEVKEKERLQEESTLADSDKADDENSETSGKPEEVANEDSKPAGAEGGSNDSNPSTASRLAITPKDQLDYQKNVHDELRKLRVTHSSKIRLLEIDQHSVQEQQPKNRQ